MTKTDLAHRHCEACEGGVDPLNGSQATTLLQEIHGDWTMNQDGTEISRNARFKNYYQTIAFVNALAWIAHQEDHHPDLEVGYSKCLIRYSTHAIGGLSENDFICAAKIDTLLE